MPSEISQRLISDALDEIGFESYIDNDCDLFIVLHADNDFKYNVQIYFQVENNWLRVFAVSPEFDSKCYNRQRNLEAVNQCNCDLKTTKTYCNKNRIVVERYELIDEYVSDNFLSQNCLKLTVSAIWKTFCRLGQLI